MGRSTSRSGPYAPKISLRWFSLTFFVSFSTTIFELWVGGLLGRGERLLPSKWELRSRPPFSRSLGLGERLGDLERERDAERGVIERRSSERGVRVLDRPRETLREGDLERIAVCLEMDSSIPVLRCCTKDWSSAQLAHRHLQFN